MLILIRYLLSFKVYDNGRGADDTNNVCAQLSVQKPRIFFQAYINLKLRIHKDKYCSCQNLIQIETPCKKSTAEQIRVSLSFVCLFTCLFFKLYPRLLKNVVIQDSVHYIREFSMLNFCCSSKNFSASCDLAANILYLDVDVFGTKAASIHLLYWYFLHY